MKEARFVVLVLTVFFVMIAPLNVYSVEHAKEYSSTAISPTSKTAYPNTTLIEIDNENSIYTAGTYSDIQPSFIQQKPTLCIDDTTPGFSKEFNGGGFDGYVIKLNASGEAIEYATYIGGNRADWITCMAIDEQGFLYIGGFTNSQKGSFPIEEDNPGFHKTPLGNKDGFLMKIDTKKDEIVYSTYIGGDKSDIITAIEIDSKGAVYVAGETSSTEETFPIGGDIPGFQQTFIENPGGGDNGFLLKVNPEGTGIEYSTYLRTGAGWGDIFLTSLAVDSDGCLFAAGETDCNGESLPVGNGIPGFESKQKGFYDGFVLKLDPLGSSVLYSTFIGGAGYDSIVAIETDVNSALYITGKTIDAENHKKDFTFPVGSKYPGYNTVYHASGTYLMKLDSSGTNLEYSTYLSTSGGYPADLKVTEQGQAMLAVNGGDTLPVHPRIPGIEREYKGNQDGYLVMFNSSGTRLEYATFIGGSEKDTLSSLALNSEGKVFVSGNTLSAEEDLFPIGKNIPGYNSTYYRRKDIPIVESFVMCIDMYEDQYVFSTYLSPK